jgi:hypothetical protein
MSALPDQHFDRVIVAMFKLTDECLLMVSQKKKISMMSTVTNKIVQTLTLEP